MKKLNNKSIKVAGLMIACIAISACQDEFENPVGDTDDYNSGTADFSKFVSIGDSLTAGYADGALYLKGQENSFPAILAQQFALVGGGTFTQPLVNDNLGGLLFNAVEDPVNFGNRLVLNTEPKNPLSDLDPIGPEPIAGTPTTEVIGVADGTVYNNVGIPGAKSFHLGLENYGDPAGLTPKTANPYFVRFATSVTTTAITDAASQLPSFFTFWIGNNDVLSYATNGGDGVDQKGNLDPTTYGSNDITDPNYFAGVYAGLLGAVTTANSDAKGILLNIPDINTLPYFTTVPYNPIEFTTDDQATVDSLNTGYGAYNAAVASLLAADPDEIAKRKIVFSLGFNPVVILDETLTDLTTEETPTLFNMRQATADDLLVLKSSSIIGTLQDENDPATVFGVGIPLEDKYVLIPSEIAKINVARAAFNATIKAAADANPNLLFLNVETIMNDLTAGINFGTGSINSTYASGGAFSLDGVHPTARGYAVIANRILDEINKGFSANIPPVNPADYTTIFLKAAP